jgi:predicted dehydrogenase
MKYKVGIAGYGIVGERRKKFIEINPNLNLVAICDKLKEKEAEIEDNISFFTDYKDLLNLDLDIIFVCMTNDIAPEVTVNSLKKGLHVFCEKPPGRNVTDIEEVIKAENNSKNQILKYGFNHRYHDSVI